MSGALWCCECTKSVDEGGGYGGKASGERGAVEVGGPNCQGIKEQDD